LKVEFLKISPVWMELVANTYVAEVHIVKRQDTRLQKLWLAFCGDVFPPSSFAARKYGLAAEKNEALR
jgi:hypothetical protein